MDKNEAVTYLQMGRGLRVLMVRFYSPFDHKDFTGRYELRGREYAYKCAHPDIKIGDKVIVQALDGMSVAEVVATAGVDEMANAKRHIVQKIDTSFVDALIEEERMIADKFAQAEIQSKLKAVAEMSGVSLDDIKTPTLLAAAEGEDDSVIE